VSEPSESGQLDVGDRQLIHWQMYGDRAAKPAVVLHGGPGSGSSPRWRRLFDLSAYCVVFFDQRGCGDSTPDAADHGVDLSVNTTAHLIADIERLRERLGFERWLVFGGSWGSTLGLAYAEAHPSRVSELVLFSVGTTSAREVEWVTRDMGRLLPEAWGRFRDGVPPGERSGSLVDAYARRLADDDPAVRERAALDWCTWEDAHVLGLLGGAPDPRYDDPRFRMRFARLVTHYWRHAAFLRDGELLDGVARLSAVPGVLVHGDADLSSPLDVPWALSRAWEGCELTVVSGAIHGLGDPGVKDALRAALTRFARF
jgi:proline iminopeptidase